MAISKERLALLRKLESIVGESCYNASIQNWGPNAEFLGEGRSFRYPITFTSGQRSRQSASSSGLWSITRTISWAGRVCARSDSIAAAISPRRSSV